MADQNELEYRLAALEKENAALRAKISPSSVSSTEASSEAPRPPTKMEVRLSQLMKSAKDLALPMDPRVDAVAQLEARTRALCSVVAELAVCVLNGLGATGVTVARLSEGLGAVRAEVEALRTGASQSGGTVAGIVEVDDSKVSPIVPTLPSRNGSPRAAPPVAVQPVGPPVGSTSANVPAEVAQLPQAPSAPIASVTVTR